MTHVRAIESAADALARLDACYLNAPQAFAIARRSAVVCELASVDKSSGFAVAAVALDHPDLSSSATQWRDFLDEEERRARGGAPLTISRLARWGFPSPPASRLTVIERELRGHVEVAGTPSPREAEPDVSDNGRPAALERAVHIAALIDDPAWAEAVSAIVLCAEGRTDRTWMLPFAGVEREARDAAARSWRDGERGAWEALALGALTSAARSHRARLERALVALPEEAQRLDALGRAAITARLALAVLRDALVTTIPALAAELDVSRPAAGDALARLVAAGIAVEVTGRQRGRAFAYAAALLAAA